MIYSTQLTTHIQMLLNEEQIKFDEKIIRRSVFILRRISPGFLPWTTEWIVPLILDNRAFSNGEMNKMK